MTLVYLEAPNDQKVIVKGLLTGTHLYVSLYYYQKVRNLSLAGQLKSPQVDRIVCGNNFIEIQKTN